MSIEVNYQSKTGQSSCRDRDTESLITNVCREIIFDKKHPRTHLLINIQEMHDDGGLLSCCINAVILALLNAGIPLKFLATAVTSCILQNGQIKIDPTKEEIAVATASVTAALECNGDRTQIVALKTLGTFSSSKLDKCLEEMCKANKSILHIIRSYLTENYSLQ